MRGGWAYELPYVSAIAGGSWFVDSQSFDISDNAVTGQSFVFTNGGGYTFFALGLRGGGAPGTTGTPLLVDIGAEYATAVEAEQAAIAVTSQDVYNGAIPLGLLVLRNDGTLVAANQFLPIDAVNRGRSYILRRRIMAVRSEL
jgi:hypothetical protein